MIGKVIKLLNILILVIGLLIPLVLFLNRFLIPDVSYDSLNYHLFLGQRGVDGQNSKYEFYPTGIHNFSPVLEIPGYLLERLFNYRIGSIVSVIFIYLNILVVYGFIKLYRPKFKLLEHWWGGLMFVSIFLSFESFLQVATYYVDNQVTFWSLLGVYFLLKYERSKAMKDLILASLSMSVLFLGKMTGGYILLPFFLYLLLILIRDKKINWRGKISRLFLSGFLVILLSIPYWWGNYQKSGNPIFPYYNSFFKSDYYSTVNFTQDKSGGDTVWDKLFWGLVSINRPEKLGQIHDLFNDYKINIYFVLAVLILIWAIVKKEKEIGILVGFYLVAYEAWAWVFGYARYAIPLEFLGGIILFLALSKLKNKWSWIIILPVLGVMLLQGKRIINVSLAYDISFRPGYAYNWWSYPSEFKNFNIKKIEINQELVKKYQPEVFLNCASPDMSYYTLSDFANLPVFNIDKRAYSLITDRQVYMDKQKELLQQKIGNEMTVKFVTIAATSGLNSFYNECIENLKQRGYKVLAESETDFLGYQNHKLKVIFGEFDW